MNKKKFKIIILSVFIIIAIIGIVFLLITQVFDLGCSNPNLSGYCIDNASLTGYMGLKKEITIPDDVETIKGGAFNADFGKGIFLEKIIVPGTVRKIGDGAFGSSDAKKIVIEEGVEVIGDYAFHNMLLEEIWFPKSIKVVGVRILDCYEGSCSGTIKVHLYKNSEIYYHIDEIESYYEDVEFIFED